MEIKDKMSLLISIIALGLSAFGVYYTSLRDAEIVIRSGNLLLISKAHNWGDNLQIVATVMMENKGGSATWVSPLSLQCRADGPGASIHDISLHAVYYAKLTNSPWVDIDRFVAPEVVRPDQSIVRTILFSSDRGLLAKDQLSARSYRCDLNAATGTSSSKARLIGFGFSLTENDAQAINAGVANRPIPTADSGMQHVFPDDPADIPKAISAELLDTHIADIEREVTRLREDLKSYRDRH